MHGKGRAGGGAIPLTIHIANQERAYAAGTHARLATRLLAAVCAATAFAFILFPVPLFPLAPALSLPEKAQASGVWPLPSPRLSVDLGFLESYEFSGTAYTHRGVDIEADAGARICAPVGGTVSFVGNVPAGDAAAGGGDVGATMQAVSVKTDDGRTVTFMPVQDALVKEGAQVSAGQGLAFLAASGDRSSASTHLHMGLKRNGSYYDPLSLFGLEGAAGAGVAAQSEEAQAGASASGEAQAGADAGATAAVEVAAPAAQGAAAAAQGAADATQGSAVEGSAAAQGCGALGAEAQAEAAGLDAAADSFGTISSGDAAANGLEAESGTSPLEAARSSLSSAFGACAQQLEGLCRACAALAASPWFPAAACAIGGAGAACAAEIRRRAAKDASEKPKGLRPRLARLRARLCGVLSGLPSRVGGICSACAAKNPLKRISAHHCKSLPCERESGVVG